MFKQQYQKTILWRFGRRSDLANGGPFLVAEQLCQGNFVFALGSIIAGRERRALNDEQIDHCHLNPVRIGMYRVQLSVRNSPFVTCSSGLQSSTIPRSVLCVDFCYLDHGSRPHLMKEAQCFIFRDRFKSLRRESQAA